MVQHLRLLLAGVLLLVMHDALADENADEDMEQSAAMIKEMDKDGDGLLSLEELKAGAETEFSHDEQGKEEYQNKFLPTLLEHFPKVDTDGDGNIDSEGLTKLMVILEEGMADKEEDL